MKNSCTIAFLCENPTECKFRVMPKKDVNGAEYGCIYENLNEDLNNLCGLVKAQVDCILQLTEGVVE